MDEKQNKKRKNAEKLINFAFVLPVQFSVVIYKHYQTLNL